MTPTQGLALMLGLLCSGCFFLATAKVLAEKISRLCIIRKQLIRREAEISRKVALNQALANQAARDKVSAGFERAEAEWLHREAQRLQAAPQRAATREEGIELGQSLGWGPGMKG